MQQFTKAVELCYISWQRNLSQNGPFNIYLSQTGKPVDLTACRWNVSVPVGTEMKEIMEFAMVHLLNIQEKIIVIALQTFLFPKTD